MKCSTDPKALMLIGGRSVSKLRSWPGVSGGEKKGGRGE